VSYDETENMKSIFLGRWVSTGQREGRGREGGEEGRGEEKAL